MTENPTQKIDNSGSIVATRSGVAWSTLSGGASVVIPFGVFVLFARMMSPSELAPVLISVAMLEIVKALGPQGVYDVVLRHPESDRRYYESASALFLVSGIGLAAVFCLLVLAAPLVLKTPLPPVLMLLGLKIVFDYLVMQPQATLARRMAFRRLGLRGLTAGVVSGIGGLLVAYLLSPVLGLASYYVLQAFIIYLLTVVGTEAAMAPRLDRPAMREMAAEGARASGVRLTAVGFNYLDQLLLSAMILPTQLGFYNLGKRIEVVSITIASTFSQMIFQPIFATADADHRASHLGRGIAAISLVCGVPMIVFATHAEAAVQFIFGAQWLPAATVVALLGLGGLARSLGNVAGALLTVSGRNLILLRIGFWAAGISVALIVGLAPFGVTVVAACILARNIVFTWVQFYASGDAKGQLFGLFFYNCFVPLVLVAVVSIGAGMAIAAMLDLSTPLATFTMLATAGLAGGGLGVLLLYRRM